MSNISRTMSVTLTQNMTVTDMIDVLVHIEKECNLNNLKLYIDKELILVDEEAFKPKDYKSTNMEVKNREIW